ncbi:LLM class flavin-dependent oxidoreductase [Spirosoma pollinicola]|uniref:Luciferase-like monooxygenase n=1 Tax=Spirosoma pollinicola TaxID=2057025 RepID=A0A2K8YZ14_9BACT|nr:LLM class flavin-dependent oxidoreductase [Spirosoma pollinicola]AUD02839.1 LLM class flavin-dependent oxidoreductase [Spirosoma pollinicola]
MIPFSILDLSPIVEGDTATQALRNTLNLAQHAERMGYNRYWLAEHHNMPGIASAATSVVLGYVAGGTNTIRVGSGGVMLPNHSPLVIAEQFGTLESLYPGRIDLGLGRAPGSDQATARALRRNLTGPDTFPQDVIELQRYFQPDDSNQFVQAVPGNGLNIPIWILGSSLFGAQLAAILGLPYAFASHFAPAELLRALQVYRTQFKPSEHLKEPYAMVAVNVIAADTDEEAQRLFTSVQQQFLYIRRGKARQMQPPVNNIEENWPDYELANIDSMLRCSAVGSPETVQSVLASFISQTKADELIITAPIYDHEARKHSLTLTAQVREALTSQQFESVAV